VQQLSISLESRAFGSSGVKTSYRQVKMSVGDILILVLGVVITGAITYWVIVDPTLDWSKTMVFSPVFALTLVGLATFGFLTFISLAIRAIISV
jgi:hypothetical protein